MAESSVPELFRLIQEEKWVKAVQKISSDPEEAAYVDPKTKMTPLHVAVCARRGADSGGTRIAAIRALLQAHPEVASMCDAENGYSPLAYACFVVGESSKASEEDQQVVELILEYVPKSLLVTSREGFSPVDLLIMSLSRLKKDSSSSRRSKKSKTQGLSSAILKVMLKYRESVSSVARSLDVLFECNSFEVLEQVALEEAQSTTARLRSRRDARSSLARSSNPGTVASAFTTTSTTNLSSFWVWECALMLLQADHAHNRHKESKPAPPFNALHTAAHIKDCPLPFLILAMRASPQQARSPNLTTGNLPLHTVAGWDIADPSSISRKAMALSVLVNEYPQATKIRNKVGKTPLSLALETGTTWDRGVRLLSFQKENSFSSSASQRSFRPI